MEANGVAEPTPEAQPLERGDSCDSNHASGIRQKAAKRRKSLGRGKERLRDAYIGSDGWYAFLPIVLMSNCFVPPSVGGCLGVSFKDTHEEYNFTKDG